LDVPALDFWDIECGSTTIALLSSEIEVIDRPMDSAVDDLRLDEPA
jgi:hypothetical protein